MALFAYQDLAPEEIVTLARLANAAYAGEDAPEGWRTLDGDDIGFSGGIFRGFFEDGYYTAGIGALLSAHARVMTDGDTLALAFRGTDTVVDYPLYIEILNSDSFVGNFDPLLDTLADYIAGESFAEILVTGHSLGAAAANELRDVAADRYDGAFEDAAFVAFASPELFETGDILNVGFEDDWVFKAVERTTPLASTQPDFTSATNNLVWYDDTYASASFAEPFFNPLDDVTAHAIANYIDASERITSSPYYDAMDRDTVVILVATNLLVTDKESPTSDHFGDPAHYIGRDDPDYVVGGTAADTIEGRAGDDLLEGAAGDDLLNGGTGRDTAAYRSAFADYAVTRNDDGSVTVEQISGSPSDGTDRLVDVERASFADRTIVLDGLVTGDVFAIIGTDGNDFIAGDPVSDIISGLAGDDTLNGRAGNDLLDGGDDDDRLLGRRGEDVLRGGSGDDRLAGAGGSDIILGAGGRDAAAGGSGDDAIDGGAGRDRLAGGAGNDAVLGRAGADRMAGGTGDDRLDGGAHRDVLRGGSGEDTLDGGAGPDVLSGGAGADTFVFASGRAPDRVRDFAPDEDMILLEGPLAAARATAGFSDDGSDLLLTAGGRTLAVLEGLGGTEDLPTLL